MAEPKMRWDEIRRTRRDLDVSYGGKAYDNESLHKNCEGCQHVIDNKKCKFVRSPRQRKWPCFFKENS